MLGAYINHFSTIFLGLGKWKNGEKIENVYL